jgi:hydroxypyruvate isomerase
MKLSVCIDAVFNGKDFLESMNAVKAVGIDAFEFWSWWDKDLQKVKEAKNELKMKTSAFCTKFISLVDASKREEYLAGLKESICAAKELDCKNLITQVGNQIQGISREEQHKNLVEGLKACIPYVEEAGITLIFEPLNTLVDHMGYYLYSSEEAFQIVDEVGSPYIKVLYDIYHQQIMEGHLISRITKNIDKIGHFHAAGNPGRHELFMGEINYPEVFKAIDETGFNGYTGLEYFPVKDAIEGLKTLKGLHSIYNI